MAISSKKGFPKMMAVVLLGFLTTHPLPAFSAETHPSGSWPQNNIAGRTFPADVVDIQEVAAENNGFLETVSKGKKTLSIVVGRSQVWKFSKAVKRISVSNPEVLDFLILSPTEVLLNSKKEGSINIIVWDKNNTISSYDVNVTKDPTQLLDILKRLDPEGRFEVFPSINASFVVKGQTRSAEKSKQIQAAAEAFAKGSYSMVEIKEAKQVLLQIRFIQLDHSQDFNFGLDLEFDKNNPHNNVLQRFLPGNTNGVTSGNSTNTFGTPANTFNIFDRNDTDAYQFSFFQSDKVIQGFLKAIEAKGLGKTIAHPNLLAKDGEEANFLVGGQAAIVTSSVNGVNVTYKDFGTQLTYKPEILSGNRIRLTVQPEVTSINNAFGVTVGTTQVPGFSTTRVKSVVELEIGQSFVIGGLLQQKTTQTDSGIPYLRRIPILGKLFQSLTYTKADTELLIIITPKIVRPETAPLVDGNAKDTLVRATALEKNPYEDERSRAIESYFKNGRFTGEAGRP